MALRPGYHQQARGIHPAAFVQPSAPDTTDVQDGVLWVDTSTAEPYALKLWDKTAGLWQLVGSAGGAAIDANGCFVWPDGVSICSDDSRKLVVTVDPDSPQAITLWGDTLDFGGQGGVVFQNGGMQLYDSSGQWLAYFYPDEVQLRARTLNKNFRITTDKIELFDQHGTLLELPFSGIPQVGQPLVAAGGMGGPIYPAWGTYPPGAVATYAAPVHPSPAPAGATADTVRCGAAHQMAQRLARLYNIVGAAVGAAIDVGGPLVASALVDIALDMLTGGTMGTWVAANGSSYDAMRLVMGGAISAIEQGLLPALDGTAMAELTNTAYHALPSGQTPITITQAALDGWATNIGNSGASFVGASDTTLRLLVPTIPLDQWQQEINTGSQHPASDCA